MADEVKKDGEEGSKGAAPAVDYEALAAKVAERLNANAQDFIRREPEPEPPSPHPAPVSDPLGDMVRGAVAPDIRAAALRAEAAEDKAGFYTEHLDLEPEEKKEVEETFTKMLRAGRPMPREDILNWVRGKNLDKHVAKSKQRDAERIKAAEAAATVGPGASKGAPAAAKNPYDMNDDELGAAVKGQSF